MTDAAEREALEGHASAGSRTPATRRAPPRRRALEGYGREVLGFLISRLRYCDAASDVSSTEVGSLSAAQIKGLTSTQLGALNAATQFNGLTSTEVGALSTAQLKGLTSTQLGSLELGDPAQRSDLDADRVAVDHPADRSELDRDPGARSDDAAQWADLDGYWLVAGGDPGQRPDLDRDRLADLDPAEGPDQHADQGL